MVTLSDLELECKRCGNRWLPRIANPAQCPRCKSPYWNRDRVRGVPEPVQPKTAKEIGGASTKNGRRRKLDAAVEAVAAIGEVVLPASQVQPDSPPPCDRCDSPRTLDYGTSWHCAKCGRNQAK